MKVLIKEGNAEITEKKSRFISYVYAVENEQQALKYIEEIKKKHWDARHNCYAYICGGLMRYSDDGEPGGTAGKPILEVIKGEDIGNCLVIVTRYFGGVLLGTGGLVRAYTESAKAGINNATIIEKISGIMYTFDVEYAFVGKLQYAASKGDFYIDNLIYGSNVTATVIVKEENVSRFEKMILEMSGGDIVLDDKKSIFFGEHDGKIATFYTKE